MRWLTNQASRFLGGGAIRWLLRDEFVTNLAAGAVNGTLAEPTGGARVAIDTNSKISISSQVINFATGAAANDGVWWGTLPRVAGRMLLVRVTPSDTNGIAAIGWDTNQAGGIADAIQFAGSGAIKIVPNGGTGITVGTYTATSYTVVCLLRATGTAWFIKGGAYANWAFLWRTEAGIAAAFPGVQAGNSTSVFTIG